MAVIIHTSNQEEEEGKNKAGISTKPIRGHEEGKNRQNAKNPNRLIKMMINRQQKEQKCVSQREMSEDSCLLAGESLLDGTSNTPS